MTNKILPNTYQAFNIYVDQAMELLTGEEVKCLDFTTRHILGWQDKLNSRRAHISISRFVDGFELQDGTRYGGTGLNRAAVIKALKELDRFGLVLKIGKPTEKGQLFELGDSPNWALMVNRREERVAKNRQRTAKGTVKAAAKRDAAKAAKGSTSDAPAKAGTSHVPQAVRPTNQQQSVPRTGAGTSDVRNQTQVQSQSQNQPQISAGNSVFDIRKVRDCVAWAAFEIKDMSKLPPSGDKSTERLDAIVTWLLRHYPGLNEADVAAEVVKFKKAWPTRRKITMPKLVNKFGEQWVAWEQESLPPPDTSSSQNRMVGRKIGGNDASETV